jgi:DDE superfamily endonuclease
MGGDLFDARVWSGELTALQERFVHRFARTEPRESALGYMRGLIAPLQRKNGWTLAEQAGHAGPDRIHRLLNRIDWDADQVLDDVRDYVVEHLGDPEAVLIVDDTGFLKKGTRSAGVQRQYSGTAGRTENCQVGVFLAYATGRGRTLIDRRLYLPTSWTDDRDRCRQAGIDDTVGFETKVAMAKTMVRRAIAENIPFRWVTADAGYGFSKGWRFELEQADVFHVMATTRHDTVVTRWALDHPVHDLFTDLPRQKWKRRSCGKGAHGLRVFDWARVEVRPWHRPDRRHWVIARRSVSRPQEISYYIAYCPAEQKRILPAHPPQPRRDQTPDPPPHSPQTHADRPRPALVTLAPNATTPSPHQPLQTTRTQPIELPTRHSKHRCSTRARIES